eukprot:CAMPEP_0168789878 /NCGR_PEP_ID=MMETSP0725-20121227/13086_1 /TAXON_ID=265536 /ORGANISM="Amphiprora sp., Strain CCMP467" /LENGTH=136 /DNA_ID=CAMNT_0008840215 /DNA_START=105 /DNA_END=512 /DNA_ORIENTATION=-
MTLMFVLVLPKGESLLMWNKVGVSIGLRFNKLQSECRSTRTSMSSLLSSSTDDFPGDSILGDEAVSSTDLDHLQRSLQDRLTDFNAGVGKRYVCRTQRGFLNVHEAPGDPFDTSNIVNQIFQGDMVTSTGPPSGAW